MGDMDFVCFSQLWESAETRFNHSNSFRCGSCGPMFDVGCDYVEKRYLFRLVGVSYPRQCEIDGCLPSSSSGVPQGCAIAE